MKRIASKLKTNKKILIGFFAHLTGPALFSSLMIGFAFLNPVLPPIIEVGEFTFRYVDAVTLLVIIVVLLRNFRGLNDLFKSEWWKILGNLFPFLAYMGLSLGLVWIYVPSILWASVASYVRVLITILIGLLIYMSIEKERDINFISKSILLIWLASIIVGIWYTIPFKGKEEILAGRYGGILSINTFGLVGGLLVVWSIVARTHGKPFLFWSIPLLSGILALFLSKSATSIMAVFGSVLFLRFYFLITKLDKYTQILRLILESMVGIIFVIIVLWILRPSDLIGLVNLSHGSWSGRLMLGYAALRIFWTHPLGVGWQASKTEAIFGDPEFQKDLARFFAQLPEYHMVINEPTSLHNMYFQILAELGIVGFVLFVYGIVRIAKIISIILKELPQGSSFRESALFWTVGLVYLLLWWNTNPLYGGHIETVLAVSFLSLFAGLWRLQKRGVIAKIRRY